MSKQGVTTNLAVSVYYDDTQTTQEEAIAEMHRALAEADKAGHFERRLVEIAFGEDHDPEPFTPADASDGDERR
jgi:allophanate hydrolase subunit 1